MVQVVQQLTTQLLKTLNEEGNVTDEVGIVDVIATLEKMPVTPEILETTRIGKHVNDIRKRVKSEALARRAKKLIKRWHKFVSLGLDPSTTNTPTSRASTPNGFVRRLTPAGSNSVVPSESEDLSQHPSERAESTPEETMASQDVPVESLEEEKMDVAQAAGPCFVLDGERDSPLYNRQWDGVDGRSSEDVFFEWREQMPFLGRDGDEDQLYVVQPFVYLQ
eukprot:m.24669 g.24669  ORF g.24669 m.24669 type:complete len:221 (+) comp28665_c0_seq3:92-754(+)